MAQARHVVVAPDSFKGSLNAVQVARAIGRGLEKKMPSRLIVQRPMSDGGDGSLDALLATRPMKAQGAPVRGPGGDELEATWALSRDDAWAYVESAQACGLALMGGDDLDPMALSTFGVGQLIRALLDQGLRRIKLGLGGSATVDGGAGALRALGARLLDVEGRELQGRGQDLARVNSLDPSGLDPRLLELELELLADVDNPLAGEQGAAPCYGPQKGLNAAQVQSMDRALARWGDLLEKTLLKPVCNEPGAGAAGGLGAGLAACGGRLRPGAQVFAELIGLAEVLKGARLAITGEGRADAQTLRGKAPLEVARLAAEAGVPVALLAGSLGPGAENLAARGVDMLVSLGGDPKDPQRSQERLAEAASRVLGEERP